MKNTILYAIVAIALIAFCNTLFAHVLHTEKTSFKVYGNCEMCEERIETALKANKAVISADWDVKTKIVHIEFDPHTLGVSDLHKIIADAGHDTDKLKASDALYKDLPRCCRYQRRK
ncbi:MAG TPA: heavy-metal-associated domain-containing protein [Cytophagales bacterium]|nr:heavy-metal-associated domain-containing protein [Cytophagales bacterium]